MNARPNPPRIRLVRWRTRLPQSVTLSPSPPARSPRARRCGGLQRPSREGCSACSGSAHSPGIPRGHRRRLSRVPAGPRTRDLCALLAQINRRGPHHQPRRPLAGPGRTALRPTLELQPTLKSSAHKHRQTDPAGNAAKLRAGGGCRAGWARRVECVGAVAGAGEEAEFGPFAELGVHVAGLDSQELGEFAAAPISRGLAGDDLGDALPPGWWLVWAWCPGGVAGAAGRAWCQGRGVEGDVDRGDGGGEPGAGVVVLVVAGGGAFDDAGAVAGPPGG